MEYLRCCRGVKSASKVMRNTLLLVRVPICPDTLDFEVVTGQQLKRYFMEEIKEVDVCGTQEIFPNVPHK